LNQNTWKEIDWTNSPVKVDGAKLYQLVEDPTIKIKINKHGGEVAPNEYDIYVINTSGSHATGGLTKYVANQVLERLSILPLKKLQKFNWNTFFDRDYKRLSTKLHQKRTQKIIDANEIFNEFKALLDERNVESVDERKFEPTLTVNTYDKIIISLGYGIFFISIPVEKIMEDFFKQHKWKVASKDPLAFTPEETA